MTDQIVNVNVPLAVNRERIADLVCCALEGGSTYWVESFSPDSYPTSRTGKVCEWGHEAVAYGAGFTVCFDDGDGRVEHYVAGDKVAAALELLAKDYPKHWADFMAENEDAETGDVYFQLLCFEEVMFG